MFFFSFSYVNSLPKVTFITIKRFTKSPNNVIGQHKVNQIVLELWIFVVMTIDKHKVVELLEENRWVLSPIHIFLIGLQVHNQLKFIIPKTHGPF